MASSSFTGQAVTFRPAVLRQQRTVPQIVAKQSRIGKQPINVPEKVKVTLDGNMLIVKVRSITHCAGCRWTYWQAIYAILLRMKQCIKYFRVFSSQSLIHCGIFYFFVPLQGPKGELKRTLPSLVTIEQEGNVINVLRVNETREANCLHGLSRSLVNNMVVGVNDGFTKTLSLVGVGYKAAATGDNLTLNLGYSHPVEMKVPAGIEVKVEKNTTIMVSGYDKELVGQFAANVRSKREPEPYKGKGVRYVDEYVRRKEGKRGK